MHVVLLFDNSLISTDRFILLKNVFYYYCVVPENIHTPTTEGMEIPEGWGVKGPGNSGQEGVGGCQ